MHFVSGPSLVARFRPDLLENFSEYCDYQSVADYIYHCNAQAPRFTISSCNASVHVYQQSMCMFSISAVLAR